MRSKKPTNRKPLKKAKSPDKIGKITVKLTPAHKKIIKEIREDYEKRKASVKNDKRIPVPAELKKWLKRVMFHQNIEEWANIPNPAFDNKKPVEVWKTQPDLIKAMVYRIEDGVAF